MDYFLNTNIVYIRKVIWHYMAIYSYTLKYKKEDVYIMIFKKQIHWIIQLYIQYKWTKYLVLYIYRFNMIYTTI